jgi:hypothetical protein
MLDYLKNKHVLYWIYFIPHDCCILDFFFEPTREM